jgi:hypothetical protein
MLSIARVLALTIIVFSLSASLKVNGQQLNFTGQWQLNKSRTDFGQAPEYVLSRALKVTQDAKGLSVDRTNLTTSGEEKHYAQQFSSDGKSTQTITVAGNMETDSLVVGAADSVLTLGMSFMSATNVPVATGVETWTLEDSGNALVIDRKMTNPDGKGYEIKGYYDKQPK